LPTSTRESILTNSEPLMTRLSRVSPSGMEMENAVELRGSSGSGGAVVVSRMLSIKTLPMELGAFRTIRIFKSLYVEDSAVIVAPES